MTEELLTITYLQPHPRYHLFHFISLITVSSTLEFTVNRLLFMAIILAIAIAITGIYVATVMGNNLACMLCLLHSVKSMLQGTSLAVYVHLFALQERFESKSALVLMN